VIASKDRKMRKGRRRGRNRWERRRRKNELGDRSLANKTRSCSY
jgi:hypothetical protein